MVVVIEGVMKVVVQLQYCKQEPLNTWAGLCGGGYLRIPFYGRSVITIWVAKIGFVIRPFGLEDI